MMASDFRIQSQPRGGRGDKRAFYQFDTEYVGRLAAGDLDTESHFAAYCDQLLGAKIRSRLRTVHLRDDVKQETFLRVFAMIRKGRGITSPGALGGLVMSICNNILRETYRAQSRAAEFPPHDISDTSDMEAALISREDSRRLRLVLSTLSEKDARLLTLLYLEEGDRDEACRRLNVKKAHLRVLMHRARQRLGQAYSREERSRKSELTSGKR